MLEHYFISEADGSLHDTRAHNWASNPLRPNYKRHHRTIEKLADIKASLRAGPFTFPGAYQLYFVTKDGSALSFKAAREEWRQIVSDYLDGYDTGWQIAGVEINYEDDELHCAHTGELIPSVYGELST